jgi:tetratricopeptide (TPR) repeat protein
MRCCSPHGRFQHRLRWSALLSLLILALVGEAAVAQQSAGPTEQEPVPPVPDSEPPTKEQPWERGVSNATRDSALELFRGGNSSYAESEYRGAADQYRKALEIWDHPRIHGNLASALIHLDQPLVAIEHLERALEYGSAPFEAHVYDQLLTNQKLLMGQLARVEIACDQPGVVVTVDGAEIFRGRGSKSFLVRAGSHQVVGRMDGHETFVRDLTLIGGQEAGVDVAVVPMARATRFERNWDAWKPWAVIGGGAAIALLGLPLRAASTSARDDYKAWIEDECPCDTGEIPSAIQDLDARSKTYNRLEVSAYVLGGAVAVAGVVLAVLNRERAVEVGEPAVVAVPVVADGYRGVSLAFPF